MATARQVEANRINALKSTGPKSAEGKARSRANGYKHGLSGEGVVTEADTDAAFEERRAAWGASHRPAGEAAEFALDRLVAASFRIEACERAFNAAVAGHAERAALSWDLDRRVDAARLASRLSKAPALVARRLEATRHGAELLIELWDRLGDAIEAEGDWSEEEISTALDLLGVHPDLRRGKTPVDPTDGSDPAGFRRRLVAEEVERLEGSLAEALIPLDALERRIASAGHSALLSPAALLIQRYERDAWRRFRESMRDLQAGPTAADPGPSPPAPSPRRPEPTRPGAAPAARAGATVSPPPAVRPTYPSPVDVPAYAYVDIAATPRGPSSRT